MKNFIKKLIISSGFVAALLISANSLAGTINFDCQERVSLPDTCTSIDANQDDVAAIGFLATSIFDALDLSITNDINNCEYIDPQSPVQGVRCRMPDKTGADTNFVYELECPFSQVGFTKNLQANCKLLSSTNQNIQNVITMNCIRDNSTDGCTFTLDQTPILEEMDTTRLDTNENQINNAFWSCLNVERVGDKTEIQNRCDSLLKELLTDTSGQVGEKLVRLFQRVTPRNTDAALDVSANASNGNSLVINSRMHQNRSGNNQPVSIKLFDGQNWYESGTLLAQDTSSQNDSSPDYTGSIGSYNKLGIFLNGSYMDSKQSANKLEQSHEADTSTLTFGLDYRFTQQFIAGAAISFTSTSTEYGGNAGELDGDSSLLTLYSSYYVNNWYLDASINVGKDNYEQERNISCNAIDCPVAFSQSFEADFDATQTGFSLGTGLDINRGRFSMTPFLQYFANTIETDGYSEKASSAGTGSIYALTVSDQDRDSETVKLGSHFRLVFNTSNGVFIPSLSLYGVEELEDNSQVVTGRFVGNAASDASFDLATNDIDSTYYVVGAGMNFQLKNGNAGFINIQSYQGYDDLSQTLYSLGWRWEI